ncbi:MAG TPA: error-prone DNA polymerase [Rhizomicrobium sp.]|jgi:error-prone DNA polymerase|nr:error-prone DNA polymerase [Rhizomicrobium sp.]
MILREPQGYAEIAVTTNYSFLRGASHPREFAEAAVNLGLRAIGIADRNTLAGVVRIWDALNQIHEQTTANMPKLLVGARLVFADGTPDILAYPSDREAYGRLSQLLSLGKLRVREGEKRAWKNECTLYLDDLLQYRDGLLLAVLPPARPAKQTEALLSRLKQAAPGRVWLAASMLHYGDDRRRLEKLSRIARHAGVPLIAINDVLYHEADRRELQDVVTCIREHVTLDAAGKLLETNAERHLKSPGDMARLFRDTPDAIAQTLHFAEQIKFRLDDLRYNYPDEPIPKGKTPNEHLADLTWKGAAWRYPGGVPENVQATLEKELALIAKMDIAPYFLTVHDIVRVANEKKILCQGRGSAANSSVCYVLGVTAVDPTQIDLLFERFISEERKEPPDIDVDFEHERREEIIQDIYERYGRDHAALTATVITYRPRSAIREVGKVFGLTEDVTSSLVSGLWGSGDSESWGEKKDKRMRQGGFTPGNPVVERAVHFANALHGFPRHLSQHVGGFVLTKDRLDSIVPIGPAAMDDRYFIEWDKDDIDALKIMKVDVLALGMLTCIRKAFDLIALYDDKPDLAMLPIDPPVYEMLCKGDAIGVFQVESRAQINMLPRLKPRKFYDLVVEVAIVRPGPIQGNMVHPYLKRRKNPELISFPKPSPDHGPANELEQVLGKTCGVPLFQEQAMKLAIVAAKFTPAQANGLRRAMATFRNVGTIGKFEEMMVGGMTRRGYELEFAQNCFNQIKGFGSYGFPESHAASFALLVYVSAWIKKYHPAAFACALLNSQPMGFYAPAELVRDAREHGVEVRHPDVNRSEWDNTLEFALDGTPILRLGFRQIEGFKEVWWTEQIAKSRGNGFATFDAFARRAKLPKRALIVLAEADCFQSLDLDRRESLWAVRRLPDDEALPLFAAQFVEDMPSENITALPVMPLSEHTLADYQMMRLSLRAHLLQFLRETFHAEGLASCRDVLNARDGDYVRCAGIVITRQMPGDAGVVFITLSDETGVCNAVVWHSVFERWRKEVMGSRLMVIEGKIQRSEDNVVHLIAESFADRTADLDRLSEDHPPSDGPAPAVNMHRHPRNVRVLTKSHDFH